MAGDHAMRFLNNWKRRNNRRSIGIAGTAHQNVAFAAGGMVQRALTSHNYKDEDGFSSSRFSPGGIPPD
jgi:hypothetical protein